MKREKRKLLVTDFSVGFVLFVATLVVIVALFFVGGSGDFFGQSTLFNVAVPSAQGIKLGAAAKVNGVGVGTVSNIELFSAQEVEGPSVRLTLAIHPQYAKLIRQNSVAWLQTEGLLGETEVHIGYGSAASKPLEEGLPITYQSRSLLDELAGEVVSQNAADLLQAVITMLKDLNEGEGTLGQLLKNETLYKNVTAFTEVLVEVTGQLQHINQEVEIVLEQIRSSRGTLGKLISDPKLYDQGVSVVQRLNSVLDKAESSNSVLARLLTDPELGQDLANIMKRFDASSAKVDRLLTLLDEGEGSLAMLLHDPSVATSLKHVFLGLQEYGMVVNAIHNAEQTGREAALLAIQPLRMQERELRRLRNLQRYGPRSPSGEEETPSGPVPAVGPDVEGADPTENSGTPPRKEG